MNDRDLAIKDARQLITLRPLFLDTETTGLGSEAEIVELALITIDGDILVNTLVKPTQPIPAEATQIHGITDKEVAQSATFKAVWHVAAQHIAGQTIAIYNAIYDTRLMLQSRRLDGEQTPTQPINTKFVCIMELYADFYGDWNHYRQSYRWQSLSNALAQQGLALPPGQQQHRALADCEATRLLLHHMAAQPYTEETE